MIHDKEKLQELEKNMAEEIVDASIPEEILRTAPRYDPADDIVACARCLICGEDVMLKRFESGPRICSECKAAVMAMRKILEERK